MGRIGRQRKFKKVDPANMSSKCEDQSSYDLAPNMETNENQGLPKRMKRIIALNRVVDAKNTKLHTNTKRKRRSPVNRKNFQKKPGETNSQFLDRLDQQVEIAVNKVLTDSKSIRSKRKSHLKKRDEKLKAKRLKSNQLANDEKYFIKHDHVNFGETVNQPPSISAIPRKATTNKIKSCALTTEQMLDHKMKKREQNQELGGSNNTNNQKATTLAKERNKAISEYRKIKYRKSISNLHKL